VDPSANSSQRLAAAKIVRGVLTISNRIEFAQTYLLKNKATTERVVLVEHPFNNDRKLVEPAEPLEKTPAFYRSRSRCPPRRQGSSKSRRSA